MLLAAVEYSLINEIINNAKFTYVRKISNILGMCILIDKGVIEFFED
jgi:hypothetical protein